MNRLSMGLAVIAVAAVAAPVHAADHLWRVSEIMLSTGGDGAAQFVEFTDAIAEPNPAQPYQLQIYDPDGNLLDSVEMPGVVNGTRLYFVSSAAADAALGTAADTALGVALPAEGQVCFARASGSRIHCVAYGCGGTPLPGAVQVPAPADGESLQRQSNGSYHFAAPTPDNGTNAAGNEASCVVDPPPDAGNDPDAGNGQPDAGNGQPDAGNPAGDDDGGGCGCVVGGERRGVSGPLAGLALLLGIAVLFRRRR